MKINEVVLNEAQLPNLKNAGNAIKNAWNSPVTQNTLQGAGDLAGNAMDTAKGMLYRTTGFGGKGGNIAAVRTRFINDFITQYKTAARSARQGGMPFSTSDFINSYLRRYQWYATPQQLEKLTTITDPKQLANAMYAVGMQQSRDKHGYVDDPRASQDQDDTQGAAAIGSMASQLQGNSPQMTGATGGQGAFGQMAQQLAPGEKPEDQTIDPASQQLINNVKKMKGPKFERDLEQIIKLAMWNLYGTDRQDYNELVKSIMNKSATKNPAQQTPQPGEKIEPTMN
jgi:hypothetical protein